VDSVARSPSQLFGDASAGSGVSRSSSAMGGGDGRRMSQSPSQSSTKTPSDTRSNASTKAEQTPETPPKEKSGSNSDPGKGPKKSNNPDNESKKANDTSNVPKTTHKKQTGARELDYWDFDGAEKSYDAIRASKGDVSNISKNTGMKEFQVERIKDHLFNKKHQLDDGVRRFDADPQIANAWKRLEGGNYTDKDVQLLKHELFESKFEGIFKVDYRTAHGAANRAGRLSGLE
jgi:hypothetical protein